MGNQIELNDTLQITTEEGFPSDILNLEKHKGNPIKLEEVQNKVFEFNKSGLRIFNILPTRCFLVHNVNEKWLYWGHAMMIEQTINGETQITSGKYKIVKIYDPEYQKQATENESPKGKSFF
jgi:hypothetical protein